MRTRNALGEITARRPFRLRYITAEEQATADAKAIADKAAADAKAAADKAAANAAAAALGFPAQTPVAEMTPEQQAAYWRNESKKQQAIAESRKDYDDLKGKAAELDRVKAENATEQDKAIDAARREGEVIGAERYLKDAVVGKFQALTGRTDEEVAATFEHVDPKSFTDDKGEIIADKLKAFADTFGPKGGKADVEDPVAAALKRQRQAGGGAGSSIGDKRKQTRERLTPSKA